MKTKKTAGFTFLLILVGVIIGLGISAGFNFTGETNADVAALQNDQIFQSPEPQDGVGLSGLQDLDRLSNAFANVAEKVNPAVVTIFTETTIQSRGIQGHPFEEFFGDEFFKRFFGESPNGGRPYKQNGLGSGVIVSSDGIIITNNHVVEGADNIKIRLMDGEEYEASVKGRDPRSDLAILKIDAENKLPTVKFGDSEKLRVGSWVLAVGSPLSPDLAHTVTTGIISAKGRTGVGSPRGIQDYLQTDAAINPGNSGGALVNLRGELIGINTAIATRNGGFMGIGFAIPSKMAKKVMSDILNKGRVVRGWLGVGIQDVNEELAKGLGMEKPEGVIIASVNEDSPADKAGIEAGDVAIKFNDRKLKNGIELSTRVANEEVGSKIKLTVLRDGKEKVFNVTLGERPEDLDMAAKVETSTSKKIGIKVSDIGPGQVQQYKLALEKGVVITNVEQGSIAAQSGLRPGHIILKINRKPVKTVADYNKIIDDLDAGDTMLMYIQQGENKIFTAFTVPENK